MNTIDTGQYLDLGGLSKLRLDAQQTPDNAETLRKVAEQFESLFVHMLLKSQRNASFGDPLFDSNSLDTFRDMQDQQMSIELSRGGGFGLADMLVQQLGKLNQKTVAPEASTELVMPTMSGALDQTVPLVDFDAVSEPLLTPATEAVTATGPEFDLSEWPDVMVKASAIAPDSVPFTSGAPVATSSLPSPASTVTTAAAPIQPLRGVPLAVSSALSYRVELAQPTQPPRAVKADENTGWSTPEQFVHDVMPHAEAAAVSLGVDPRVLVAQAALETGWGRHMPHDASTNGYNLFGIKADTRWDGDRVAWDTLEHDGVEFKPTRAQFRAYEDVSHAVNDYVDFIQGNPRYQDALANAADPRAYVNALQQAGYATDPAYADKVLSILQGSRLNAAITTAKG